MIRPLLIALAVGLASGCSSNSDDIEALQKEVEMLNRRVSQLEGKGGPAGARQGGKKGSGRLIKSGPRKGTPPPRAGEMGPPTAIEVAGDAPKVFLEGGGERYQVPAEVPAGKYAVLASFDDSQPVVKGHVAVMGDNGYIVECSSERDMCVGRPKQ